MQDDPLTAKVQEFAKTVSSLAPDAPHRGFSATDLATLDRLVAVADFRRVGIWREEMDWPEFLAFCAQVGSVKRLETTVRRITEVPGLVYYELEERQIKGDEPRVVNSMNVFGFNEVGKICSLDVYLQGRVEPSIPFEAMRFT